MTTPLAGVLEGYLDLRYQLDPVAGTRAGRRELDGRYATYDAQAVRAQIAALRSYTGALEEAAADTLDEEIDRTAALHDARSLLVRYERERPFLRDPSFHLMHALNGLFVLLTDETQDAGSRAASLAARLRALPEFLTAAAAVVDRPVQRLVQLARAMVPGGAELMGEQLDAALVPAVPDGGERAALRAAATDALARFAAALADMEERAHGDEGVGTDTFERLLHTAHMIQDGAGQLLRWAEEAFAAASAALPAAAAAVEPGADWRAVVDRVERETDRSAAAYRGAVEAAARAAVEHGVIGDVAASVRIAAMPGHWRPLAPAAVYEDGGTAGGAWGTLYVAGEAGGDPAGVAVRDVVPGRGYQAHVARGLAEPLRRAIGSEAARAGWAAHAEAVMADAGVLDAPAVRLLRARDAAWRALRVIVDVSLHTKRLTAAAAERRLRDELGLDAATAWRKVARACAQPTVLSGGAAGAREIARLRDDARQAWGEGFSLRRFHDELLRYGAYPTALARWGMGLA